MRRYRGPLASLCTVACLGCLLELFSVVPMGACGTKQLSGARDLGASPRGTKENTESREVARARTKDSADRGLASVRTISPQACRRKRSTVSRASKALSRPQQQHRGASQFLGVGACGLQTLTVPEAQPYLAEAVHPSILGRFYRPKNAAYELSVKLNVAEGDSQWVLGTPETCSSGSKQNSLPGLSNAVKLLDPAIGGTTDVGTSPESSRSDGNPYIDRGGMDPVQHRCRIDYPQWEVLPKSLAYVLPLSPERSSPRTPLSISPMLESRQPKILCVSTISADLPQFNFEKHGYYLPLNCIENYAQLKQQPCFHPGGSICAGVFQEKAVQITGADSPVALEKLGVSVVCKKGYKPNCPNNDGFFVSHVRGCIVCCVLEGHGPFGHEICHAVQQDLLRLTTDNPDLPVRSKSVLQEAFLKAHSNLQMKCNAFRLDSKLSGTTVTILVYLRERNKLFVAHVGNSRAVLCKFNRYGCGVRAVDLTVDHTPTNNKELRRIVKAGGQVRALGGDGCHRIFLTNGYLPGLAVARSIGDTLAGNAGVIALPEIKEYKIDAKRDKFLLLCTDGVWNVISSQEAVEIAHSAKQKEWRTAPEELARESWRRWISEEQIFADDMTVLFLKLC